MNGPPSLGGLRERSSRGRDKRCQRLPCSPLITCVHRQAPPGPQDHHASSFALGERSQAVSRAEPAIFLPSSHSRYAGLLSHGSPGVADRRGAPGYGEVEGGGRGEPVVRALSAAVPSPAEGVSGAGEAEERGGGARLAAVPSKAQGASGLCNGSVEEASSAVGLVAWTSPLTPELMRQAPWFPIARGGSGLDTSEERMLHVRGRATIPFLIPWSPFPRLCLRLPPRCPCRRRATVSWRCWMGFCPAVAFLGLVSLRCCPPMPLFLGLICLCCSLLLGGRGGGEGSGRVTACCSSAGAPGALPPAGGGGGGGGKGA